MSKGRIVVIESDDWISRLLADGLKAADYEVIAASDALGGFRKACETQPDCVICAIGTARLRRALGGEEHSLPSLRSFQGAAALAQRRRRRAISARRLAGGRRAPLQAFSARRKWSGRWPRSWKWPNGCARRPPRAPSNPPLLPSAEALRGSLEQMSVATVMSLLELERRTGQLKVTNGGAHATIELVRGFAITSTLRGVSTPLLATVRELLNWNKGLVSFYVGKDAPEPDKKRPIGALLMEAVQLNATSSYCGAFGTSRSGQAHVVANVESAARSRQSAKIEGYGPKGFRRGSARSLSHPSRARIGRHGLVRRSRRGTRRFPSRRGASRSRRRATRRRGTPRKSSLEEATLGSRLNHPGIVRTHDFFARDGRVVLVLEHVDGITLATLLAALRDARRTAFGRCRHPRRHRGARSARSRACSSGRHGRESAHFPPSSGTSGGLARP